MWSVVCFFLVILYVGTVIALFAMRKNDSKRYKTILKEHEDREYRIEMERKKAEISNLQSQINPHFLYNTLEVIRSEAIINRDMDAAEMVEALANYFRYNISKKKDVVTLGEELTNIDNYISIQKRRFEERITYKVRFYSNETEAKMALIPKLTLQPLVENSIYHGIEKLEFGGVVIVRVTVTAKRLLIQVDDNGPGMDQSVREEIERKIRAKEVPEDEVTNNKRGGIALRNIHQRIQMLYGSEYGLSFYTNSGQGMEVHLTLPYYTE